MSEPRGPTTEELRARALAHEQAESAKPRRVVDVLAEDFGAPRWRDVMDGPGASWHRPPAVLVRPCLACNREPGERMCDLCQRLEEAEAAAP